jgi:hypothetical protein
MSSIFRVQVGLADLVGDSLSMCWIIRSLVVKIVKKKSSQILNYIKIKKLSRSLMEKDT